MSGWVFSGRKSNGLRKPYARALDVVFLLLIVSVLQISIGAPTEFDDRGKTSNLQIVLEPKLYWFYEAMGKLEYVKIKGDQVEGAYSERLRLTPFTVKREKLRDPEARTKGYKMAVQKIIAFMAPDAIPDTEANRKYMTKMKTKLKTITGVDLTTYNAWKKWFDTNQGNLKWSDEKDMLFIEREDHQP